MRLLMVGLIFTASCINSRLTPCGNVVCSHTQVCAADQRCVTPDQLVACELIADGERCTYSNTPGFCHNGACVENLSRCGDGVPQLSRDELCDCGSPELLAAPAVGCAGFNSNEPGATCRLNCDDAGCGDAIRDPSEQCDDGNTRSGDGCRSDCQGRFTKMQTPTASIIGDIAISGPDEAWASGALAGVAELLRYRGGTWAFVAMPPTFRLTDVGVLGGDVYVFGDESVGPALYRIDGTTWVPLVPPPGARARQIWGTSRTDLWAIVCDPTFGSCSLTRFNGQQWSPVGGICSLGVGPFVSSSVIGTSPTDVYVVEAPVGLCHFDGVTWTRVSGGRVESMAQVSSTEIATLIGSPTSVIRWTNGVVSATHQPPGFTRAVAGAAGEILVVGGQGVVLSLVGTEWTHLVSPTELELVAIEMTSPTNVFIVGVSGTILH